VRSSAEKETSSERKGSGSGGFGAASALKCNKKCEKDEKEEHGKRWSTGEIGTCAAGKEIEPVRQWIYEFNE
jgi:hypothetical protein